MSMKETSAPVVCVCGKHSTAAVLLTTHLTGHPLLVLTLREGFGSAAAITAEGKWGIVSICPQCLKLAKDGKQT